jgi:DNA-binding NarL/FixJ family response regulator
MARELSDRLINILVRLAEGDTDKEIADATNFGERTVKGDVSALCITFGARNRTALVAKALREGVIE